MSQDTTIISMDGPGDEGLCINCGVFCPLYEDKYCEECYEENVNQINKYTEIEVGVSERNQHIDDIHNHKASPAIDRLIPYSFVGQEQTCSVCMETIQEGNTAISLPCAHTFHAHCVYAWLSDHDCCPHCRSEIR